MLTKKLIHFDLRNIPAPKGIANDFLAFHGHWIWPHQWTSHFRNTRKEGIPWYTQGGTFVSANVHEGQKTTSFIRGTKDIKWEWHKAVPQVTLGINVISTNQWRQIKEQTSHTHTCTQGGGIQTVF
jgi:hypothetical protein